MPFGLSFAQIMDLADEIPDLVGDVKKLAPKLAPLLEQVSATIGKLEKAGTLNEAAVTVTSAKELLPQILTGIDSLRALLGTVNASPVLGNATQIVSRVQKDGLLDDVARMASQIHVLLPDLPPLIAKVAHALKVIGESDTPEQAKAKIANTDWSKVVDRAGGAGTG